MSASDVYALVCFAAALATLWAMQRTTHSVEHVRPSALCWTMRLSMAAIAVGLAVTGMDSLDYARPPRAAEIGVAAALLVCMIAAGLAHRRMTGGCPH